MGEREKNGTDGNIWVERNLLVSWSVTERCTASSSVPYSLVDHPGNNNVS